MNTQKDQEENVECAMTEEESDLCGCYIVDECDADPYYEAADDCCCCCC